VNSVAGRGIKNSHIHKTHRNLDELTQIPSTIKSLSSERFPNFSFITVNFSAVRATEIILGATLTFVTQEQTFFTF